MNIHEKIRQNRMELKMTQEQLAEAVLVSRQTISNWENNKNLPDIQSLVLLAQVFNKSLDELVNDQPESVKSEKLSAAQQEMRTLSIYLAVCFVLFILLAWPLLKLFGLRGLVPLGIIWGTGMYFALKVEKIKKANGLRTYQQISEFMAPDEKPADLKPLNWLDSTAGKILFGAMAALAGIAAWLLLAWLLSF